MYEGILRKKLATREMRKLEDSRQNIKYKEIGIHYPELSRIDSVERLFDPVQA